jgi:peptidoglycan/LPS O-acetylase OafA/YrhL
LSLYRDVLYRVVGSVGIVGLGVAGCSALTASSMKFGSVWTIGFYAGLYVLFPALAYAIVSSDERSKVACAASYFMVVGLISVGLLGCMWLPGWRTDPDRGVFIQASVGAMFVGILGFPFQLLPARRELFGLGVLGIVILVLAS